MKLFSTTILLAFFSAHLFGQANFLVEGKTVETGSIVRTYDFGYESQDSINLFFADSSITFTNPTKTIVKQILYCRTDKEPSTTIKYFRTNGEDSISKHFSGGKLRMIYSTRFDSLDRIVYYGMEDFTEDSTFHQGFEWTYEYRDSLLSTGKVLIQTVYVANDSGGKDFHFRILNEYDKRNRKIKETREREANDPLGQITHYKYDARDSLIEENIEGIGNTLPPSKHTNTRCDLVVEKSFSISNFSDINILVKQLLLENRKMLMSDKCENYCCSYISPDKQMTLTIIKRQPYWCEGRRVVFRTIQTL